MVKVKSSAFVVICVYSPVIRFELWKRSKMMSLDEKFILRLGHGKAQVVSWLQGKIYRLPPLDTDQ